MALNYVTVTGTFDDGSGSPLPGVGGKAYCQFTPNQAVYASGVPLITPAQPIQASINNGSMSVQLLATDNTGLTFGGLTGFFYWTVTLVLNGQNQPSWSFFLPHTPSPVDLSALINTAAGGGGGTSLPLTTLGDLLYENATPAAARLAGNTTAAKQFLTQTGTGTVSAAPAWAAIAAGDVPGFDGVTVTGTPSSGQVPTATGGTAATWQAPGVAYQPWQFQPETYGAKGDGKVIGDAVLASNTTLTSVSAGFTSADTGKHIMINGAIGTANIPLITTITFVNSTTVTLAATATVTGTGFAAVYGTDDTAAFNSAFAAAKAYAVANNWRAQVVCKDRIYVWSAAPIQASNPTYNTQVQVPFNDLTGASQKLMIDFIGAGHAGTAQFWQSTVPNLAGTCIVSMQTAPSTPDVTFGIQSVLGGPSGGTSFTAGVANTHLHIDGIAVYCPIFTNMKAYNFGYLAGTTWGSFSANIFAPAVQGNHPVLADLPPSGVFQGTIGIGCIFPYTGNNDDVTGQRFAVEGYETGFVASDHFSCPSVAAVYTDLAYLIDSVHVIAGGNSHLISILNFSCESYNGAVLCNGGYATVNIGLDTETINGTGDPAYDVKDQGSNLHGIVRVTDNNARTARRPVVTNCANLKVVNDMMGPGAWSGQPAVPATTVAQQNTSWRDAAVSIKGGTVTVIAVDGVTVATATNTTVIVPAGKNITLTYSGAPTWAWTLL